MTDNEAKEFFRCGMLLHLKDYDDYEFMKAFSRRLAEEAYGTAGRFRVIKKFSGQLGLTLNIRMRGVKSSSFILTEQLMNTPRLSDYELLDAIWNTSN